MSAAHKGIAKSPEHRAKIGASNRKPSPAKSAAMRGRSVSPETRAKISARMTGQKLSAETRAKISATQKGKPKGPYPPERLEKLRRAWTGRKHTPESKAKIAASQRGKTVSEEARAKMRRAKENGKDRQREHGLRNMHIRWHVNRGIVKPDCKFCPKA